ncbi:hypothetical protein D7Y13_39585 [Corallococcus praedator]|uniref:B box-type domain-containing protein n=1 Tax=Corallococcus praedator TaxID=2316724 RepID=A0ABX9Q5J6_9BACT|nr:MULTISPECIES: hypothetical protein [Corallococcus]RKH17740.1 hypothetical protein D7X75_40125 [Corallococcus sp. CA031C]RKH90659.1 hypothetical protein D7Y13_39585 [Corallococcus praedator]
MVAPAVVLPDARCGQHPTVSAVALCARCGGFLCGACTEVLEETAYCEPCAERRWQDTRPWRAGQALLVANILGLLLLTAPLIHLSWTTRPGRLGGVEATLLQLGWTLASGVGGIGFSTWKLGRQARAEASSGGGLARALRILSALNLLGVALWSALAVFSLYFFRMKS